MTTEATERDLVTEVEELLAKATLTWTDERPDDNGIYWYHEEGCLPELLLLHGGLVYDFGDNEPTSVGFYDGRGKFRGPVFASDTEGTTELLRRLVEEVKTLRKRIKTMERDAREDAQAAANEARWQERQGEDYGSY